MKTIKVIDLLNMIANKEYDKLPRMIKYMGYIYNYDVNGEGVPFYITDTYSLLLNDLYGTGELLDYVEIIEEPKSDKIEKLGTIYDGFNDSYYDTCLVKIAKKVDEVIDKLNKVSNENTEN